MMTANCQNETIAYIGKGRDDGNMSSRKELTAPSVGSNSALPPTSSSAAAALPKCICNWKNCRAYQKAFREVKHPTYDGVVKIKIIQDHIESMAYKECLDRSLGVIKCPEWKRGSNGKGTNTCKYIVAKHHFTERHMQKYDASPKTYSFVKPFTLNGAKKYLFKVQPTETLPGDYEGGKLYLQCPNVPKDVVKHEFHQAMETVRAQAKQRSQQQQQQQQQQSNNKGNVSIGQKKNNVVSKKGSRDSTSDDDDDDDDDDNKSNESSHHVAMLKSKEAENKLLKDQLEAMKSQLLLLNDMVVKLQEQHFDNQSVVTGRSFRSNKVHGSGTSSTKKTASSNTATTTQSSTTTMNRSAKSNNNNNNKYQQQQQPKVNGKVTSPRHVGGGNGKGVVPNNRRGSIGVPTEIDFDEDDDPDMDSQTLPSVWQEGETDWTETQFESDDDEDDDDDDDEVSDNDDGISLADRTVATSQTFKTKYKMTQGDDDQSEQNSDDDDDEEDDDEEYDDEDFETMSLAATTIVSASKSVKTLPREMELDEDEDSSNSHQSLEEEAFETRSFTSRSSQSIIRHGGRLNSGGSSFVSSSSSHQSSRKQSILPGRRNTHGGKKSNRQMNSNRQGSDYDNRQGSISSVSQGSNSLNQCTQVKNMDVTDPYGEKGSYTGSVNVSTGMPHGKGRLEYERDGRWYEGDWKQGRWTGQGRLSNGDGDLYEGGLQDDHKHGYGKMKFADGRTFEGTYVVGQMVQGTMTYQDGSTYDGTWEDGMRHGTGRCVFMDLSIYEGEFREGEFHSFGKMTWNDGGWYEGEWMNGEMHGKGREIRADGTLRHDGEWVKGQPLRNRKPSTQQQQQQQQQRARRAVAPV